MVTVIKHGRSLSRILRYNEVKVEAGQARPLASANCPFDAAAVPLMVKVNFLERMALLNPKVTHPSVHISLNFPPSESGLSDARMSEITTAYLERIGFSGQPWMAYRHTDAGHPHLHIVTLKVRPDGSRIDMHNLGRNQSEVARRQVEQEFGLVPAEKQRPGLPYTPEPVSSQRLQYGKAPTKKAISSVLRFVLDNYRFTSLGELNAILTGYNIRADRGKVTSRTFVSCGLLYRCLDAVGTPVGVPVKASDFHFSPTLKKLETGPNGSSHTVARQSPPKPAVPDGCCFGIIPQW